jgi:hypothetical protein
MSSNKKLADIIRAAGDSANCTPHDRPDAESRAFLQRSWLTRGKGP